ncbi:MAG TPA: MFS transporter [Acidimicrobiia bacterium]|nr:MFS transporter [Acidimicrobiia bacterium]
MTAAPNPALIPFDRSSRAYHQRWWVLGVMCLSLLVIIVDNSILNVALPTLVRELDATNSELQWMVDSYTLVFAGLLLTAGSLGDRFGRRGALQVGLVVFGLGSLLAALSDTPAQLIATRGLMGVGGAFIMPATLSIITNVFPPEERGRAIGMWAGIAGVATALGPITGGFLLEHFYWGSVFTVNLPIVVIALVAGVLIVPTSSDPSRPRQDPIGALLSIVGLVALLYGIIEGPERGWTDTVTLSAFALGALVLLGFAWWEARSDHPMLDVQFFKNPRFTAASLGITAVFFAMFGATFLLTQHLQFVMGYSPLQAGVRLLPWAAVMLVVAPSSARLVERFGTKAVVTTGLGLVTVALALLATIPVDSSYVGDVLWRMMLMATGMALVMAPATESIMGSLPRAKAGVGSAVNDTTRQVGGALGVAIVGSVMSSIYRGEIGAFVGRSGLPTEAAEQARASLGGALQVAGQLPAETGALLVRTAQEAFVTGLHRGVLVASGAALIGAVVTFVWLPARGDDHVEVAPAEPAEPLVDR